MAETFVCSHCGQELPISERDEFDGQALCQSCLDMLTVVCRHCETLIVNKVSGIQEYVHEEYEPNARTCQIKKNWRLEHQCT